MPISQRDRIHQAIAAAIAAGEFDTDGRLPSVRALCQRFAASANTVANAISRLSEAGLCTPRAGLGVFLHRPACSVIAVAGPGMLAARVAERLAAAGFRVEHPAHPALHPALMVLAEVGTEVLDGLVAQRQRAGLATIAGGGCLPPDLPCTTVDLDWFRLGYRVARARQLDGRALPLFAPRHECAADRHAAGRANAGATCALGGVAASRRSTLLVDGAADGRWAAPAAEALAVQLAATASRRCLAPGAPSWRLSVPWPDNDDKDPERTPADCLLTAPPA